MTAYCPPTVPAALRPKVMQLLEDPGSFAQLHKVINKELACRVQFMPLPMQFKIFEAVKAGHKRIAVVKARQVAATTASKMVLHWLAYTATSNETFAILSSRDDSAKALLAESNLWAQDLPAPMQRKLASKSKTELVYADTGASLRGYTSRSASGMRSFSPSAVVLSEFAFAPDQEELLSQILPAVGKNGLVIIESTANNPSDLFSKIVSARDQGWHVITHWWWEHPTYRTAGHNLSVQDLTSDEVDLRSRYNLDLDQLAWRRQELATIKVHHKFAREYPACLDDCFLSKEGGFFSELETSHMQVLEFAVAADGVRELEAPHHHDRYVMGVDVGGGVGRDFSTIAVVSVSTHQPVYLYRSNGISPTGFAHKVIQVATRYNTAFILAEENNHGHALFAELDACRYMNLWASPKGKRWTTTLQSKQAAFNVLRDSLPLIKMIDRTTYMELRSLIIKPGKICPEAPTGSHDDSAMALALAYQALVDVPPAWRLAANLAPKARVDDLIAANRARRIRAMGMPF